jgi:hypothetical protein
VIRTPKSLNPFQKMLTSRGLVYVLLVMVTVLGVVDIVMLSAGLFGGWTGPHEDFMVSAEYNNAIRLVAIGVFLEVRGTLVEHLRGEEVAESPPNLFLSETSEVYGATLTVLGLFMEMIEGVREVLPETFAINVAATGGILLFSLLSMHVIFNFIRDLLRGPSKEA